MTEATTSRFGRYEVLGALPSAEGAETLVAIDQQSGRRVALRIVKIEGLSADALAAFTRELRALGRVRHPGLPTIYDVGSDGKQLYVAEEPVLGTTLDKWLLVKKRSWREIGRVFVSISSAVSAIHGAGLVCRGLTDTSVLITKDGRVVVNDVGLHRPRGVAEPPPNTPEERAERPGDALTDQLALTSMLFRALFGGSPFRTSDDGRPTFELVDTANAVPSIPASLRALLDQGLAREPSQRFASLSMLAFALHGIVERRRHAPRMIAAAAAAAVLATSTGSVFGAWVRGGTPFASIVERLADECRVVEPTFEGVWTPEREEEVRRALWRSAGPEASAVWVEVRRHLDTWTKTWSSTRLGACTPTRDATGESLLEAQRTVRCLQQARARLVTLLDSVPELGPRRTLIAARSLGDPGTCPSNTAGEWLEYIRSGRLEQSVPEPTAQELRGVYSWAEGTLEPAIVALEEAIAKHPEGAADVPLAVALGNLGFLRAEAGRLDDAQAALRRAIRMRERLGAPDTVELASLWFDLGTVLGRKGATVDALAAHRRALDIIEAKLGPETLEAAESLRAIARLERDAARSDESVASYRRALSIRRAALGEDSGEVAVSNVELGWALLAAGLPGEATERFTVAEHVAQAVTGRPSLLVARAMEGRGVADLARGQASKAAAVLEEALALLERTGSDPAYTARLHYQLSRALGAGGGDRERARRLALTAQERLGKPDSPEGRLISAWLAELEGVKKP